MDKSKFRGVDNFCIEECSILITRALETSLNFTSKKPYFDSFLDVLYEEYNNLLEFMETTMVCGFLWPYTPEKEVFWSNLVSYHTTVEEIQHKLSAIKIESPKKTLVYLQINFFNQYHV